jgi:hypothetical protein
MLSKLVNKLLVLGTAASFLFSCGDKVTNQYLYSDLNCQCEEADLNCQINEEDLELTVNEDVKEEDNYVNEDLVEEVSPEVVEEHSAWEKYFQKPNLVLSAIEVSDVEYLIDQEKIKAKLNVTVGNNGYLPVESTNLKISYFNNNETVDDLSFDVDEFKTLEFVVEADVTNFVEFTAQVDSYNKVLEIEEEDNSVCKDIDNNDCLDALSKSILLPNYVLNYLSVDDEDITVLDESIKIDYKIKISNNGYWKTGFPVDLELRVDSDFDYDCFDGQDLDFETEEVVTYLVPILQPGENYFIEDFREVDFLQIESCEFDKGEINIRAEVDYQDMIYELKEYDNDDYLEVELNNYEGELEIEVDD